MIILITKMTEEIMTSMIISIIEKKIKTTSTIIIEMIVYMIIIMAIVEIVIAITLIIIEEIMTLMIIEEIIMILIII
jgi:hypothetical protein